MDAKLLLRKLRAHTLIYSEHDRAAEVVADLMAERDRLRRQLAALSLCEPGFLDRVIRERDEAKRTCLALQQTLRRRDFAQSGQ